MRLLQLIGRHRHTTGKVRSVFNLLRLRVFQVIEWFAAMSDFLHQWVLFMPGKPSRLVRF